MSALDISKLIEAAEKLAYDGHIEFAAQGEMPVQILTADDGSQYQLKVVMELI